MLKKFVEVKKALLDCDLTVTKLAVKTGYSRIYLYQLINGNYQGPNTAKVKRDIADALGRDYESLWGEGTDNHSKERLDPVGPVAR